MNQLQHKILSFGLLLCLGLSIVPAESFHAHEESSVVCQEDQQHIANHSHECELADFILPSYTELHPQTFPHRSELERELLFDHQEAIPFLLTPFYKSRAPPAQA